MGLRGMGYSPRGIRIDSGDLAYLFNLARAAFERIAEQYELHTLFYYKIMN